MGLFDFVKSGVQEMMVARPDDKKSLVVYKHPNQNVVLASQLTVDSDEVAVFFKDGVVVGVLPPGRHTLHTQNIPFLNRLVVSMTGGNVLISEIFFVKTAPIRGLPFGAPIGEMIDPLTGEQVTPRIFGEFSVVVTDPATFIISYSGQARAGDNDEVFDWVKGLFVNGVKTTLGELCEVEQRSLLQVVSLTQKISEAFVTRAPDLNDIGVRVLQMGRFEINFSESDRARLVAANAEIAKATRGVKVAQATAAARQFELDQRFAQDSRYVKDLAGNFQTYAAGSALIASGEGMREHGGGAGGGLAAAGMQLAVGANMAGVMAGAFAGGTPGAVGAAIPKVSAGGAFIACGGCSAQQPAGTKFCAECGLKVAEAPSSCVGCGASLAPGAKFCANCGTKAGG